MIASATTYWRIAKQAIIDGLLTLDEAKTICRAGTRKQGYWGRHIKDLEEIVRDRAKERNEKLG